MARRFAAQVPGVVQFLVSKRDAVPFVGRAEGIGRKIQSDAGIARKPESFAGS